MAGIGFQLRKMLRSETFSSAITAYGYAAMISSGPWLLSIGTLALLGLVIAGSASQSMQSLFFVSVTHVIAASLILTGPLQLILSRYAADELFKQNTQKVFSSFVSAIALTTLCSAILGLILFVEFGAGNAVQRLATLFLFILICNIWICNSYVTVLKNYKALITAFAVGYGASFVIAAALNHYFGSTYVMLGLALGQSILFFMLFRVIADGIGSAQIYNFAFLQYFRRHPALAACGLFYNLGLWIDKFLYWWFSPQSIHLGGIYHACPVYDIAVYLSFVSIAPGMAVFLIKFEADFALAMESLTQHIIKGAPVRYLEELNRQLIIASREGLALQLKLQLMVTLLLIIVAPQFAEVMGINALQRGVFEITLLGVITIVVLLSLLTILFYIERLRIALACCLIFGGVNAAVTYINIQQGEAWYGIGIAAAGLSATLVALVAVNRMLRNLLYRLFSERPIEV